MSRHERPHRRPRVAPPRFAVAEVSSPGGVRVARLSVEMPKAIRPTRIAVSTVVDKKREAA